MSVLYFVVRQTMYSAIPLLIVAIGVMYLERNGVINIAPEGIMIMGAFVGVFFTNIFQDRMSGQGPLLLTILIAGVAGGIFLLLHAFATINMRADQIISGTALDMFTLAFAIFTARMIRGAQQIQFNDTFHIDKVPVLGDISVLGDMFFKNCYITIYLGILIFTTVTFAIKRTRFGPRPWACGEHPGAADSVGVNVVKICYAGVIISGVLGGIGGLVSVIPISTNFNASVVSHGFLVIAVLILGQWRSNKILMAALFSGIMKTLASAYSVISMLKSLPISSEVYEMTPHITTLTVLAFLSKASQALRAEGIPYDKGSRQ